MEKLVSLPQPVLPVLLIPATTKTQQHSSNIRHESHKLIWHGIVHHPGLTCTGHQIQSKQCHAYSSHPCNSTHTSAQRIKAQYSTAQQYNTAAGGGIQEEV
jgi:hypothetical protein